MNTDILFQIGLTKHQVAAYRYLLGSGPTPPPKLAKKIRLSRSNAYKVLDQLIAMRLVSRLEYNKKLHYKAEDPIALASIAAEERNRVIALEKNIKEALKQLRDTYQKSSGGTDVQTFRGPVAIKALYEHQIKWAEPVYFIKSRADIPYLGFEAMDNLRKLSAKYTTPRFGITPDSPE